MNAPAPKTSPDTALGNLMAAALDVPAAPEQPAVPDDTLARTGNTARDQEMYAAGIRTGEENAKHNAAIRAGASWQPIESAPKTGCTLLLGYWNSHGKWRTVRGQWISAEYIAEHWEEPDDAEEGWFETAVEAEEVPNCWRTTPSHWQPLPAAPGASTAGNQQPARDWELTCHECDGSGHVYVKHQVAERKTDMQEFKEECECCEGRGFVFAFQDIPGIEEYVKACRTAPAAGDALDAARWRAYAKLFPEVSASFLATHAVDGDDPLPTIKGASITGGYVVVTPAGWDADNATKLRDAILRLFPVNPVHTPRPSDELAAQRKGDA